MSFTVQWHPQAFKNLEQLPKHLIARVLKKLDAVALDPFRYLEHFEGERVYKLRIGEYRALVDVLLTEKILLIQHFDTRGRVYKRQDFCVYRH